MSKVLLVINVAPEKDITYPVLLLFELIVRWLIVFGDSNILFNRKICYCRHLNATFSRLRFFFKVHDTEDLFEISITIIQFVISCSSQQKKYMTLYLYWCSNICA